MTEFVLWMDRLPNLALYIALSLGAAVENLLPAVPADTFVAIGGVLAGAGDLTATWIFLGTWLCNVAGALFVYRMSHLHGPAFFERGLGRHVLKPHQMRRMSGFYDRWGTIAIFLSRFLPGVRAIVPVFAGATHQPWSRVVLPLTVASAIWYGSLVRLGVVAGRNLVRLEELLAGIHRGLALVAVLVSLLIGLWWYRTRIPGDDQ
ncbi:MAG: DedA family protein [Longimicrobiales bacterium]|nr:DedA family protein [Longimicrobiales bacterium]